jgi:hypothetical protein
MFPIPPPVGTLPPPGPPNHKQSITTLLQFLESHGHQALAINGLAARFNISSRRLYDFINVLSAIGGCRKSGPDQMVWLGRAQIPTFVREVCRTKDIDNPERSLCDLFAVASCIGISNLTISLLLLFHALRTNHLDLRSVSQLFTRQTRRYKSTLCKLYQICYILGAAGITNRTSLACDVVLLEPYLDFQVVPPEQSEDPGPLPIVSLLNHQRGGTDTAFVQQRRRELQALFAGGVAHNTVSGPE